MMKRIFLKEDEGIGHSVIGIDADAGACYKQDVWETTPHVCKVATNG